MRKVIWISILFVAFALIALGGYLWYTNWKTNIMKIPPEAPSDLIAEPLSATEIKLTWVDNSNNELGFKIVRNDQMVCDLSEDFEEYVDSGLKPATNYEYRVIAYNLAGETNSSLYVARTNNPPIRIWIDKIGVTDNGEDYYRELFDKSGEIFVGIVITDGKTTTQRRLPARDYYHLADNEVTDIGILVFFTGEVGEYLRVNIISFENDGGLGDELLCQALDMALKASMGNLSSLILTAAGVDFTDTFREIIGFEDDYLGEYQCEYKSSDNWGVGEYSDIKCQKEDGNVGLRLWFRIDCPIYDYSSEETPSQ